MKSLILLSVLACLIALSGCSQKSIPPGGVYVITQIDDTAVDTTEPILVLYKDDKLAGKGPVNRWTTPVLEDGKLGIVISTRMAGPPEQMELESKLLQALEGGTLKGGLQHDLVITKNGQDVILLEPTNSDASELMD